MASATRVLDRPWTAPGRSSRGQKLADRVFDTADGQARDLCDGAGLTSVGTAARSVILFLALLLIACAAPPSGPFVVIETASDLARFRVEIADTDALRERGLMGRTSLADDAGMLFVWPEDTASAFWMKDTLIRLSVAFISADGQVLRMFDMEPCQADPCPVYDPHASYRMALEVRQGALDRRGVRIGDRVRLVR